MPRKPRVHFSGAIYHVTARGNNKAKIFAGDDDKQIYLQKVMFYRKKFFFEILIYAIMDNHIHMVIRVSCTPLSKIMHGIQKSYARYYNEKYGHHGHVFEDRYKAYLCNSDSYLLTLLRYIHFNPAKAGLSADLKYGWSSHLNYCGIKKDGLVSTDFIVNLLMQGISTDPVATYLEFIEQHLDNDGIQARTKIAPLRIPGSMLELEELNMIFKKVSSEIVDKHNIHTDLLGSKSRSRNIIVARKDLISKLYYNHKIPCNKIAALMGVSRSYISQVVKADK